MKIDGLHIIEQLERLAAAFPWDPVELDLKRTPEGEYRFVAYLSENEKFGFPSIYASGESPEDAVSQTIRAGKDRDPEIARRKKITDLQEKIEKLQALVIGLPPYRPGRELTLNVPATVDV